MPAIDPEFLPLNEAARLLCRSRAGLYLLAANGRLDFAKIGGRTVVSVKSVRAMLKSAEPYAPATHRTAAATRARVARSTTSATL